VGHRPAPARRRRTSQRHEAGAIAVAPPTRTSTRLLHQARAGRDVAATARERAADPAQAWAADFTRLRASYARGCSRSWPVSSPPPDELTTDDLAAEADRLGAQARIRSPARTLVLPRLDRRRPARRGRRGREDWRPRSTPTTSTCAHTRCGTRLGGRPGRTSRRSAEMCGNRPGLRQQAGFVPGRLGSAVVQEGGVTPVVADWADALGTARPSGRCRPPNRTWTRLSYQVWYHHWYHQWLWRRTCDFARTPKESTACRGGSDRSLPAGHPPRSGRSVSRRHASGRPTGSRTARRLVSGLVQPTTVALSQGQAEDSPARGHDQSGSARARRSDLSARLPGQQRTTQACRRRTGIDQLVETIDRHETDGTCSRPRRWPGWRSLGRCARASRSVASAAISAADDALSGGERVTRSGGMWLGLARLLNPPVLRSLGAIHLAAALLLDADLVLAYDERLIAACRANGLTCKSPGR